MSFGYATIAPKIEATAEMLEHLSGQRYANPLIRDQLIPIIQGLLSLLKDLAAASQTSGLSASAPPGITLERIQGLLLGLCNDILAKIHEFLVHLSGNNVPNEPSWLHYFITIYHNRFLGLGHIHLLVAPTDNQESFAYFPSFKSLLDALAQLVTSAKLYLILPPTLMSSAEAIIGASFPNVAIQILPWDISFIPHLAAISTHELAHHVARYFHDQTNNRTAEAQLATMAKNWIADHAPPVAIDRKGLQTLLALRLEEVFADLFALYCVGPAYYLLSRKLLAGIQEPNVHVDLTTLAPDIGNRAWRLDPMDSHPMPVVRILIMARMLAELSGGSTVILEDEAFGVSFRELATKPIEFILDTLTTHGHQMVTDQDTYNAATWQTIVDLESYLTRGVWECLTEIMTCLQQCAQQRGHGFPQLDAVRFAAVLTNLSLMCPATDVLIPESAENRFPYLFLAALKCHESVCNGSKTLEHFQGEREVVLKSFEDVGVCWIYGDSLYQ